MNIAYLAREDLQQMARARAARIALLKWGLAEPETFYIVEDEPLWKQLICIPASTSWHGTIDGMHVVVPDSLARLSIKPHAVCGA